MKRIIALLLVLVMVFALCACGNSGKSESIAEDQEKQNGEPFSERWEKASEVDFLSFCSAYEKNKVSAKNEYIGNDYKIMGYIYDIQDEYILMYPLIIDLKAKPFVSIKIPLRTEDILKISTNQVVTIYGEIIAIEAAADVDGQDVISVSISDEYEMEDSISIYGKIKHIGYYSNHTSGDMVLSILNIRNSKSSTSFLCYYSYDNTAKIKELINGDVPYREDDEVSLKAKVSYVVANGAAYGYDLYMHIDNIDEIRNYTFERLSKNGDSKYTEAEAFAEEGKLGSAAISFWNTGDRDARQCSLELWAQVAERKTIEAGGWHTVGVKNDGTVIATGEGEDGQKRVSDWTDIIAVSACFWHTVGLKSDGTVVAVGDETFHDGQCNVGGWRDIVAVAAGDACTLGLKADGTVVVAGKGYKASEFSDWSDIISISAGGFLAGLKEDGTVVAKGGYIEKTVAEWRDIVSISVGYDHIVGLKSDGTVVAVFGGWSESNYGQCDVSEWTDIVAIAAGNGFTVGLKADGTVVAVGQDSDGQVSKTASWTDIVNIAARAQHTVGVNAEGTIVAVGYNGNGDGHCNVSDWEDIKMPNTRR